MIRIRPILFFFLLSSLGYSVDKTGTTAAKFLSTNIGSKAVGMGGAFTALANDGSAMYWNPAGIGFNRLRNVYHQVAVRYRLKANRLDEDSGKKPRMAMDYRHHLHNP